MVFTGTIFYIIATLAFAIAVGGIFYQHMVEFRNWSLNIPESLIAYRNFYRRSDFGSFFRVFMPTSFLSLLVSIAMLWNYSTQLTTWSVIAAAGMFATAGFTNAFFVPKHKVLFEEPVDINKVSELKQTARQWRNANYVRMIVMGVTLAAMLEGIKLLA